MTSVGKSNLRGVLLALAAFGLFATHDVFVKFLGAKFAPFQIVFFSVLLSFPLVTLMLMRDATKATLIPVHPWWTALRTLAGVMSGAAAFYAFTTLPLAQVYAILFAAPLLITVLSIPILGERVGPHRWGAVVVGLVGVLVVLRPGATSVSLGHLAALTAALASALAAVVIRKIGKDERSAVLLLYPMMANVVVMGATLPLVYVVVTGTDLAMFAGMATLGFVAGLCIIGAYKAGDAAIVAPMQYSQILWAAAYGVAFFDEFPDLWTWAGAAVVILSGVYIVLRESLVGISATTPVTRTRSRQDTGAVPPVASLQSAPRAAE